MDERQHSDQCGVCGEEFHTDVQTDVLCPDCTDTWQREIESTW